MRALRLLPLLVLPLTLLGCANDVTTDDGIDEALADAKPAQQFVLTAMDVPDVSSENDPLGFDLDHDRRHTHDNKIGSILQLSAGAFDIDPQEHVDAEVAAGRMVTLVTVRSDGNVDQSNVSIELTAGVRDATGVHVAPGAPTGLRVYGRFVGGRFQTVRAGRAGVKLSMLSGLPPVSVELQGAIIEATLGTGGNLELRVGGGILHRDMEAVLMPQVFTLFDREIATMAPTSQRRQVFMQLFDTNHDDRIVFDEFVHSNTVETVMSPDVDLVANELLPAIVLEQDGFNDSVSVGVAMIAQPTTF